MPEELEQTRNKQVYCDYEDEEGYCPAVLHITDISADKLYDHKGDRTPNIMVYCKQHWTAMERRTKSFTVH